MSEYQYYEFLAVDRPLTPAEQSEVRALSSRAQITATGFTNEYDFGDFRGDPQRLMEQYYDAHLYITGWGTNRVMLRLPKELLDLGAEQPYLIDEQVEAWVSGDHLVLDLRSEDETAELEEDNEEWLPAMVDVRTELASGDLRPLYLAWLAAVGAWERDEEAFDDDFGDRLEPPVPAGLGSISAPQQTLADFLRLDADLLAVAAEASPEPTSTRDDPRELDQWIANLPETEKNRLLQRVARGEAALPRLELLRRFHGAPQIDDDEASRRTVAALLDTAAERRQERENPAAPLTAGRR